MKFSISNKKGLVDPNVKNFKIIENTITICISKNDFFILDNEIPINHAIYIQGMNIAENIFLLEIRFKYENDFSHYKIEVIESDCISIVEQYYKCNLPDINLWEDITSTF